MEIEAEHAMIVAAFEEDFGGLGYGDVEREFLLHIYSIGYLAGAGKTRMERVDASLRSFGHDPEAVGARARETAEKAFAKAKAAIDEQDGGERKET